MAAHPDNTPHHTLRTTRAVINALGGPSATAGLLEVRPSAVSNWIARGVFPPARYLEVSALLAERGFEADRLLFREHSPLSSSKAADAS